MAPHRLLLLAGGLSVGVALLHVAVVFAGAPAYRYFGAGERMAFLCERGAPGPALLTIALALLFASWGAYGFSGAGLLPPLPWLRAGLVTIGATYTLRGLVLLPQIVLTLRGAEGAPAGRHLVFSLVSLAIGTTYLLGTWRGWATLPSGSW